MDFQIERGSYLCIIGDNGSGKSTLLKGLLRLKKPDSGTIIFCSDLKQNEIGYLPQKINSYSNFPASVEEIVLSGTLGKMGLRPFYSKAERLIAHNNMEKLHITDLKNRCISELSGGQQQRVLIARALCAGCKILLMDEPTSGLDPQSCGNFFSLILELNKSGWTIIMATHDINAALEYSTNILHLKNRQLFFGPPCEYKGYNFKQVI